jgi:hypothetical protein
VKGLLDDVRSIVGVETFYECLELMGRYFGDDSYSIDGNRF